MFYRDLALVNRHFKQIAHEYKLRTKIYKTNDESLFNMADIYPETGDVKDEKKAVLAVYKNGSFYKYPYELNDESSLTFWIFHSHFPHLSRITNDNFQAIFHGIQAVLLLVTRGNQYLAEFEKIAKDMNEGIPFMHLNYAAIDVDEYSLFVPSLLPNIDIPSMVIFDPTRSLFFHRKINFKEDFKGDIIRMIDEFKMDKLPIYPHKSSFIKYSIIFASVSLIFFIIVYYFKSSEKPKTI